MSDNGFPDAKALAAKVEWEGGASDAILGYGLKPEDLPADVPDNIREAWQRVHAVAGDLDAIDSWVNTTLDDGVRY